MTEFISDRIGTEMATGDIEGMLELSAQRESLAL